MISLSKNHSIVNASIIVDNETVPLKEKPQGDSGAVRCHFFERTVKNFRIILRLDWDDLDKDGNPTLDADIDKDGKKYKVGRKQWHHTLKTFDNGEYVYIWKPEGVELSNLSVEMRFKLQTTNQQTLMGRARIAPADKTIKISKKEMKRKQKILDDIIGNLK